MTKHDKIGVIMRKHFEILLTAGAVLLVGCIMLFPNTANAQCSLSMDISSTPVTQLSPSDIDFEHFESRNLLFTATIKNSNEVDVYAKLEGTVDIFLADGTPFNDAVTFTTNQFSVSPGGRTITNLNIGRNADITLEKFQFDQLAKEKVQDIALSTGKFPAGRYVFQIKLTDLSCNQIKGENEVTFNLQNASRIELRSPAEGATTNEFPFFEFFQEGERAVLKVAEKTENQSAEDAIDRKPAMVETDLVGQNSFLYSGGRPLEPGKTYVWQVVSKSIASGGGSTDIASEIRTFTVSNTAQAGGLESVALDQLKSLFGSKYQSIFEFITNNGYQLSGPYTNNGVSIDLNELLKLLNNMGNTDNIEISFE